MKYGLLKVTSFNIGDEIQCIAAIRFLPQIDYRIQRERIKQFKSNEKVKLIMNHYWMHCPKNFPPSQSIEPLYVSFHLKYTLRNNKFLKPGGTVYEHFKTYEPIGCRDKGTADFLNKQGINAYFSGCLTTTLVPNPKLKGQYIHDYILCVDVADAIVNVIKKRTNKKVICIGREQNVCFTPEDRFELAKFTLFLYHNAHCVVTVALHAALPSTAFGTPVCVIDEDDMERNTRFDGLEDLFHRVKEKEFLVNEDCYNIDNPPNNPKNYKEFRDQLVKTCTDFTGYDSNNSIFEDDYNPTLAISQILRFKKAALDKALMFASGKDLIKTAMLKALHIKDKFSY